MSQMSKDSLPRPFTSVLLLTLSAFLGVVSTSFYREVGQLEDRIEGNQRRIEILSSESINQAKTLARIETCVEKIQVAVDHQSRQTGELIKFMYSYNNQGGKRR